MCDLGFNKGCSSWPIGVAVAVAGIQVWQVEVLKLNLGMMLKEGCPVLTLTLLDPMSVDPKSAGINYLIAVGIKQ